MKQPVSTPAQKMATPWGAMSLVFELGYIIALPAAAFGFGGAYLDKHYVGLSPLLTIAGLILAFILSSFIVVHRVKAISKSAV